jgi:hypothetical protein
MIRDRVRAPHVRWLLVVFAVAFAVRLAVALAVTPDPRDGRFDDSVFYDAAARHLADGDGYVFDAWVWVAPDGNRIYPDQPETSPTALWPPGYPLTLAAVYAVTDDSTTAGRLANAVFGALTAVLVYLIALRLFVHPRGAYEGPAQRSRAAARNARARELALQAEVRALYERKIRATGPRGDEGLLPAIAAGLAIALMPSHVLFTSILMSETYFGFLLAGTLAFAVYFVFGRRDATGGRLPLGAAALALGVLVAWTGMVRGEFTVFGGIFALLLLYEYRRRSLVPLVALAAGALIVITPWTIRNQVTMGEAITGTTGSGRVMYQGHNPDSDGGPSLDAVFRLEAGILEQHDIDGLMDLELLSRREGSRLAREWALDHPLEEIALAGKRMHLLFRSDEAGVTWLQSNRPWFSAENVDRLINLSTAYFWALAALMVASLPVWWRREAARIAVFAVVPYYMLIFGVLFIGDPRYHYAMYVPMAVFAGAGIAAIARITADQWREAFGGRPLASVLRTYGTPE